MFKKIHIPISRRRLPRPPATLQHDYWISPKKKIALYPDKNPKFTDISVTHLNKNGSSQERATLSPEGFPCIHRSGRSSDLPRLQAPFPFPEGNSGVSIVEDFSRAYSSGSVQDSHLIPFSSSLRNEETTPKQGRIYTNFPEYVKDFSDIFTF